MGACTTQNEQPSRHADLLDRSACGRYDARVPGARKFSGELRGLRAGAGRWPGELAAAGRNSAPSPRE